MVISGELSYGGFSYSYILRSYFGCMPVQWTPPPPPPPSWTSAGRSPPSTLMTSRRLRKHHLVNIYLHWYLIHKKKVVPQIKNCEPSEHGQVIYQNFTVAFHGGRNSATFSVECGRTGAHTEREGLTQKAQSSTLGGVQYLSTCQGTESQVQITKVFSQDIIAEITSCFDCGLPAEQNLVIICTRQSEHCALCRAAAPHGET